MCICVCLRAGVSGEAHTARREGCEEGRAVGSEEADTKASCISSHLEKLFEGPPWWVPFPVGGIQG